MGNGTSIDRKNRLVSEEVDNLRPEKSKNDNLPRSAGSVGTFFEDEDGKKVNFSYYMMSNDEPFQLVTYMEENGCNNLET